MAGIIKSKPKMLPMVGGVVNGIVTKKRICLEFHNSMRNAKKKINSEAIMPLLTPPTMAIFVNFDQMIRAHTYMTKYTFANYYEKKNEATSVLTYYLLKVNKQDLIF